MKGEIIAIGNELTSGRIANTTSGFAARQLFEAGYEIHAMHTIGDSPSLIGEALKRAIDSVDFVIVTGGLGATDDDLTNEAVSMALNRPTMPNLEILSLIRAHLDEISGSPVSPLEKLAWLPVGAEALNPKGKMAGYQLVHDNKPVFFLPGIPRQMEQLLIDHVLPRLATWYPGPRLSTCRRLFKIFDMSEMEVNSRIATLNLADDVAIGYYPVYPEVHLSLIIRDVRGNNPEPLFQNACAVVDTILGDAVYGHDQESMELVVGSLLKSSGRTVAMAESCTGGLISHKITTIPGSSEYFLGGVTAYANSMKITYLNVDQALIETHGAVSEEVARAMAEGIRTRTGADIGLSVTGIAGPDGGTPEKPVGTVFFSLVTADFCRVLQFRFSGSRDQIQEIAAFTGMNLVRKYLLNKNSRTKGKLDQLHQLAALG
jgi:nicotinamide-nucleotide amidase